MPRVGSSPQDTTDIAGDLGRAILLHFGLPPDEVDRFYPEPNPRGLFILVKSGTVERRAIVLDADQAKEKLNLIEELKLLLDSMPTADRSKALDSLGLVERPNAQADPGLPISSILDLESIFAAPEPVEYLIAPEIPAKAVVLLAGVPESGKSTLACAWGRDLAARGHPGKSGDLRGSSDFAAAADQGFIVTNSPAGKHRLSRLALTVHKTRYALSTDLVYNYDGGKVVRVGAGAGTPDDAMAGTLKELLRNHPGIGTREFEMRAHESGVPHHQARRFLKEGVESGKIRVKESGRTRAHFLCDGSGSVNFPEVPAAQCDNGTPL